MQLRQLISVLVTAEMALAVDMTYYNPLPGVTVEFRAFIEAFGVGILVRSLVGQADNATATEPFTGFFTSDGRQTTLAIDCVGPAEILKCKQSFLPPDGRMTLTHFPNNTFVFSDTADSTVYEVQGRIENNFKEGNCSQIYYKTQYTILKTPQGDMMLPNLAPEPQRQVSWYHDYFINPTGVPSDIPCDSLMQ